MKRLLKPREVSTLVGIEEREILRVISRNDPEVEPYLIRLNDERLIDIAGLPVILKKLAYNMPTTEIIENLACQILHLELISQLYEELKVENERLKAEIKRLRAMLKMRDEGKGRRKFRFRLGLWRLRKLKLRP